MVPVKTMKEYDLMQDLTVLFCETVDRSVPSSLLRRRVFLVSLSSAFVTRLTASFPGQPGYDTVRDAILTCARKPT